MNLFVVPAPASTLEPREAGLARELGAGGFLPAAPDGGPPLQLEILDTASPAAAAEVAARGRALTAAWGAVRGAGPRFETTPAVAEPGGSPGRDAAATAWSPAAAGIPDLDGPGAQAALRKILAQPRASGRAADPAGRDGDVAAAGAGARLVRLPAGGRETFAVIAAAGPGRFCSADARRGAGMAVAESLRDVICTGATPALLVVDVEITGACSLDRFRPFADGLLGIAEAAQALEVPVFTTFHGAAIAATGSTAAPAVGVRAVGRIAAQTGFRAAAGANVATSLILLGGTPRELGGSRFLAVVHGQRDGAPPALDLPAERRLQVALRAMLQAGLLAAAQTVAAGGMMVAACELLLRSPQPGGARLDLTPLSGGRADTLLFGESPGCVIAAVASERVGSALAEAHMRGVPAALIGKISDEPVLGLKTRSLATEWSVAELSRLRRSGAGG